MIICVISDNDHDVMHHAEIAVGHYGSEALGGIYCAFRDVIPSLRDNEDLIIMAYGTAGDSDTGPKIGNFDAGFSVTPDELFKNLESIFPSSWSGNTYVEAGSSADAVIDPDPNLHQLSFIEDFGLAITDCLKNSELRIFGRSGAFNADEILPPLQDRERWIQAEIRYL